MEALANTAGMFSEAAHIEPLTETHDYAKASASFFVLNGGTITKEYKQHVITKD